MRDPASFRDPKGHVHILDGRVFRAISSSGVKSFEAVSKTGLYEDLISEGKLVPFEEISPDAIFIDGDVQRLLEHERLPFISYPYEWPFDLLKSAAMLQLDLILAALDRDITLSDASAYNLQFQGVRPIFIDCLSFRPYVEGEVWTAHRQFCEQFLNPLLLRAKLGVPHNALFRGSLTGLSVQELDRLLPVTKKLSWNTLIHVVAHARLERLAEKSGDLETLSSPSTKQLSKPLFRRMITKLRDWVAGLAPADSATSVWGDYEGSAPYNLDEAEVKHDFVSNFVKAVRPVMLWDIGCNAGNYTELALRSGASVAIGFDSDQIALDRACRRALDRDLAFTPLYIDVRNPSPNQGWRQQERYGLERRGPPDAILALSLLHHLVITENMPVADVVDWLTQLAPQGVIEFAPRSDPMVQKLMHYRGEQFEDYSVDHFLKVLGEFATIVRRGTVSENGRELFWYCRSA